MKRMMSTIVLCLASSLPLIANADGSNLNSSLRGDYAFSGDASCVTSQSSQGISAFFAINPSYANSFSVEGVLLFNGDGTGTVSGRDITISNGNNGAGIGPVIMGTFTADLTYTVAPDHSIHIDHGPFTTVQTVGPNPGITEVWIGFSMDGHVSQHFNTLTIATAAPNPLQPALTLEYGHYTINPTGPLPPNETRACHRSRVLVKIDGGPRPAASQTMSPLSH